MTTFEVNDSCYNFSNLLAPYRHVQTPSMNQTPSHQTGALIIRWLTRFLLVWGIWSTVLANAGVLTIQPGTQQVNPIANLEFYKDSTGKLGLEDIKSPSIQARFKPALNNSEDDLNFSFTDATYWIKLTVQRAPGGSDDWVLEIPYLTLNEITLFAPGHRPVQAGTNFSSDSKPIFYPFYALPLRLSDQPQTLYLKARSEYALTIPLKLWSRSAFSREFSDKLLSQALYFGGLLSLALYNFLLFLSLKDRSYLYYTLFAFNLCVAMFAGNGYGRLYLWPNASHWDMVAQTTFFSFAGALYIRFTSTFLRLREFMPILNRCFMGFEVVYLLIAALLIGSVWGDYSPSLVFQLVMIISLPVTILAFYAAYRAYTGGNTSSLYFLLASGSLWIGIVVAVFRAFDLVPSNAITLYAVQIGSCVEMLLLSFALAHRIHAERENRILAQEATIEARNALLVMARENEAQLENKVFERTQKLQQIALDEKETRQQYVRFGAMIAHEFRNPLGIIETQSSLIQREHQLGIDKINDRAETILGATHRLAQLFEQWIKSDQLQQPISQPRTSVIQLDAIMRPVIKAASTYHRDFTIAMQPVPNVTLDVDQSLLEIALLNLIDNACKYSPTHSVINVSFQHSEQMIGIMVSDTGLGIPLNQRSEIFKAYVRIGNTEEISGFGLGLAFVAHIAELHHGRVEVHGEPNKGSQFILWVPCL